mgnify:CR=1 FL=1
MFINTLLFWSIISITIAITLLLTKNIKLTARKINYKNMFKNIGLKHVVIGFIVYLVLFWLQEYLYFFHKITLRSEKEALSNGYDWFDFTTHRDNLNTSKGDLSEGIYDSNYTLTAEQAMFKKYNTYYQYLNLAPGKTLVDLGSGYCHWIEFCKNKGVIVKGITLSKPQKTHCNNKRIKVVLDDFRHYIQTTRDSVDAVSAIGTQEHLASMGMTEKEERDIHNEMLRNIRRILKPDGRALITIMLLNPDYPKWKLYSANDKRKNEVSLVDKIHLYNLTCFYGCGRYPIVPDYNSYVKNCFDVIKIRNYTEDYRWAGINFGEHHWQNGKIYINTPYRFMKLIQYFFTDMWIWGRVNYSLMNSWYWQFGGTQKTPIINNNKSPVIANIYVLEPKQEGCSGKSNPEALHIY